jgi:hypothetical protein
MKANQAPRLNENRSNPRDDTSGSKTLARSVEPQRSAPVPALVYRINIVVRLASGVRLARSLALADASAGGIDLLAKRHLALREYVRAGERETALRASPRTVKWDRET